VADPDAATADRVRGLHRTPRHVVLVFSGRRVALFEGSHGRLSSAAGTGFPMDLPSGPDGARDDASLQSALVAVGVALNHYLRTHPAPVILAGPQTLVTAFWSASGHLAHIAGTVYGGFGDSPTEELARRVRPALGRYLDSHRHAALALLENRGDDRRVASGITSVWHAARTRRPETLLVEDGYHYRAHRSPDGATVAPAPDDATAGEGAGDLVDDLVDDLVQTVLTRGGSIVLAHDGGLTDHDRIALTLH